jgi:hypothetical protein
MKVGEVLIGGKVITTGIDSGLNKMGKSVSGFNGVANSKLAAVNATLAKGAAAFHNFYSAAASKASSVIGPLTRIASTAGLVSAALETISLKNTFTGVTNLNEASRELGITVGALGTLRYQAKQANVSVTDLESGIANMTSVLNEAALGFTPAGGAIEGLGLKVKDLIRLSPDKAFLKIQSKLAGITSDGERAARSMEIFGSSTSKLNPLLALGGTKMAELAAEAKKLGVNIGGADNQKLLEVQAAMSKIGSALEGVGNTIAIKLAPYIEAVADGLTKWAGDSANVGKVMDVVVQAVASGIDFIITKVTDLQSRINSAFRTFEEISNAFDFSGKSVFAGIGKASSALKAGMGQLDNATPGQKLLSGYDSWIKKIDTVAKGTQKIAKVQIGMQNVAAVTSSKTVEAFAKMEAEASKWKDMIRSPIEVVKKELDNIHKLEAGKFLNPREAEMARRVSVSKLNSLPRFAGAQELGTAEARSSILHNTSGYTVENGIPKLVGFAGEQLGVLKQMAAALIGQNAQGARNQGQVDFIL